MHYSISSRYLLRNYRFRAKHSSQSLLLLAGSNFPPWDSRKVVDMGAFEGSRGRGYRRSGGIKFPPNTTHPLGSVGNPYPLDLLGKLPDTPPISSFAGRVMAQTISLLINPRFAACTMQPGQYYTQQMCPLTPVPGKQISAYLITPCKPNITSIPIKNE